MDARYIVAWVLASMPDETRCSPIHAGVELCTIEKCSVVMNSHFVWTDGGSWQMNAILDKTHTALLRKRYAISR